ncbi:MAG: hypothetical protein ACSLFM_14400, partial [Tepidiformaceae bacterium]
MVDVNSENNGVGNDPLNWPREDLPASGSNGSANLPPVDGGRGLPPGDSQRLRPTGHLAPLRPRWNPRAEPAAPPPPP